MSRRMIAGVLLGLAGSTVCRAEPPFPGPWELVFADEFDGTSADLEANWEFQNGPSGHILCSRWRENAVLDDGLLRLVARKETRAGQDWTAASLWTRRRFRYGYFECRYRYAAATGTNNSFWIMTRLPRDAPGRFEIDINEGHYPNEVNMNLHNHSGEHWAKGGRWYFGDAGPLDRQEDAGFEFVLEAPVRTDGLRFVSRDAGPVRVMELRVLPSSDEGYPSVFPSPHEAQPDVANLAGQARATATSCLEPRYAAVNAVDGVLSTDSRWVSDRGDGPHALELSFGEPRGIGCIQFISGWLDGESWRGIVRDFRLEYRDGDAWRPVPGASRDALARAQMQDEDAGENLANSFHTYGLLWTEDELVYTFDGREIRRMEHEICRREAPVWLSLAIIRWAGAVTDAIDGTSMDVDYVKVWQRPE